jgi:hypothetical protein
MPVKIYIDDDSTAEVAWLCDDEWNLREQVCALHKWLEANKAKLASGCYIADIGFSVRKNPGGGGAALSPAMMRDMADLGISLFLSEYPRGNAAPE